MTTLDHRLTLTATRLWLLVLVLGVSLGVQAQSNASLPATEGNPRVINSKPTWQELTANQKQALSPLSQLWPSMSEAHKRKWLALSHNFSSLSDSDKNTLQSRMREWVALSPQQRAQARLNFADAKQLPQDERRSKWEAYQALTPEEKQKLASQKPVPKVGAAIATKPVPPEKLAMPPTATQTKALPRIASDKAAPATLLPNTAAAPTITGAPLPDAESTTSEQ